MKKITVALVCVLIVAGFYACTHKAGNVVVPKNDTTNNNHHDTTHADTTHNYVDTSVCFQRDILPIFQGSCAISGCHDPIKHKSGYTLNNYANIVAWGIVPGHASSSTLYTVCVKGSMPQYPTPKLDSTKLSLIARWINQGAHNDTNCAVICDTTKYTYAAAIVPILKNYCYSCHTAAAAGSNGGGIALDTYNSLLVQANNGKLLGDIQHAAGFNAMPLGSNKLQDCQITQVRRWIQAGAQNN